MTQWFQQLGHALQIRYLLAFKPTALFARINRLEWYETTLRHWANQVTRSDSATVLDIGCATGGLSEHLAGQGHRVTGADKSPQMIEAASSGAHRAKYLVADICRLPFEDHAFDTVIAASLINLVPEPEKAISEMARVCKPGGAVSALVPKQGFTRQHLTELQRSLQLSGFSAAALKAWHRSAPKIDKGALKSLFRAAGLEQILVSDSLGGMLVSVTAITPTDQ